MVSLPMKMKDELADGPPQRLFPEKDKPIYTLLARGRILMPFQNESFSIFASRSCLNCRNVSRLSGKR
jgi:hypothetical protein